MDETARDARPDSAPEPEPVRELPNAAPGKTLTPAAKRALEEAAARQAVIDARAAKLQQNREINGRGGLEPVRYTDWEVKGLASDF
ncbi:MAG: DUF1674 domain-containing protein [Bosea sp.]|jgi:hypothetical protein|nr:DUF1674 domain-containing protein [Bosea sp. (in: a-proteobacteria)]